MSVVSVEIEVVPNQLLKSLTFIYLFMNATDRMICYDILEVFSGLLNATVLVLCAICTFMCF